MAATYGGQAAVTAAVTAAVAWRSRAWRSTGGRLDAEPTSASWGYWDSHERSAPRSTMPICISKMVEALPCAYTSAWSRSVVVEEKPNSTPPATPASFGSQKAVGSFTSRKPRHTLRAIVSFDSLMTHLWRHVRRFSRDDHARRPRGMATWGGHVGGSVRVDRVDGGRVVVLLAQLAALVDEVSLARFGAEHGVVLVVHRARVQPPRHELLEDHLHVPCPREPLVLGLHEIDHLVRMRDLAAALGLVLTETLALGVLLRRYRAIDHLRQSHGGHAYVLGGQVAVCSARGALFAAMPDDGRVPTSHSSPEDVRMPFGEVKARRESLRDVCSSSIEARRDPSFITGCER